MQPAETPSGNDRPALPGKTTLGLYEWILLLLALLAVALFSIALMTRPRNLGEIPHLPPVGYDATVPPSMPPVGRDTKLPPSRPPVGR
jgi:hypothetical protein